MITWNHNFAKLYKEIFYQNLLAILTTFYENQMKNKKEICTTVSAIDLSNKDTESGNLKLLRISDSIIQKTAIIHMS